MVLVSESQLKNIIDKCVKSYLVRERINENIKQSLLETFNSELGNDLFEADSAEEEKSADKKKDSKKDRESESDKKKRNQIEDFFRNPAVNNASYAYELYNVKPSPGKDTNAMKNARKKFSDNLNHAENEEGYSYSFSSSELNKLQSLISRNRLAESIEKLKKMCY